MKWTAAILVAVIVMLPGCAGKINKVMDSWMGAHYSNLIASWGPPQQVFDDGGGGRLLVWTQGRSYTVPGYATTTTNFNANVYDNYIWGSATSRTVYNPAQTYGWTAYRMFWIGSDGRIYRWAWKGF
jgi:hypothetical protein